MKRNKPESDKVIEALRAVEGQAAYEDIQKYGTTATPEGWTPGVNWSGNEGEITTGPLNERMVAKNAVPHPNSWDDHMRKYGLDPEKFQIVEDTVRYTAWHGWTRDHPDEAAYMTILYSFRAVVKPRSSVVLDTDWAEVYEEIKAGSAKKPRARRPEGDYSAFLVNLADWQMGNGDTTPEAQVEAVIDLVEKLPDAIADARAVGHRIDEIVIAGLGDLVEQCDNNYPSQTFMTTLNRRDQMKIARRGVRDVILATYPLAPRTTVVAVGGNHGENRKNGKAFTNRADNDDVALFESLAEGFQLPDSPFRDKIKWIIPNDSLVTAHSIGSQKIAWSHGHLARPKAGGALHTYSEWIKNQVHGGFYPELREANHIIFGHYHHFAVRKETAGKMLYVCPSLTRNSVWFGDATGIVSDQGTLTMVIGDECEVDMIRVI